MKNPLYPYNIINDETINNYNRCIVMTLEKQSIFEIFNKDILTSSYFDDVKNNYSLKYSLLNQLKKSNFLHNLTYHKEYINRLFDIKM